MRAVKRVVMFDRLTSDAGKEHYSGHVKPYVGGVYKTRSGRIETIDHFDNSEAATPYRSTSGRWFSKNGIHYADGDTRSHDLYTVVKDGK